MAATRRTLALLVLAGLAVAPQPARAASPTVCALYCDTRDPSLARQETVSDPSKHRRLGTAALNSPLIRSGILTESCDPTGSACADNHKQFKGIFMRYLLEAGPQYQQFANTRAATLWAGRDPLNRISSRWAQPSTATPDWRTQASALAALLVAQ